MTPTALFISPPARVARTSEPDGGLVPQLRRTDIFRTYRDAFESITGLPLTLRQPGSFQLPLHGSQKVNPFCALMGRSNTSCAACLQLQHRVETDALEGAKTLECFAGLSESAVPVRIGHTLVGYLQTGQVFLRPPTKRRFREAMLKIGETKTAGELHELETAYFQTRIVAFAHYESVIRLLVIFADHLAALSNQFLIKAATSELPVITRARVFIADHQGENMRLPDVARAVNMSAFYFCKVFKRATGFTFTSYLARVRIATVKQLLLQVHVRVGEAAFAAGFQSLSQFNRSFQRVTGESPTDYRDRLHGRTIVSHAV